jgi:hypothetical protein
MREDMQETPGSIRTPSFVDTLIPVGTLLVLQGLSYYSFHDDASYGHNYYIQAKLF